MRLGYAIPRDIIITPSGNMGFVVKIGCGIFVAESTDSLEKKLTTYLDNPEKWEKKYNDLGKERVSEDVAEVPGPTTRPAFPSEGAGHSCGEAADTEENKEEVRRG